VQDRDRWLSIRTEETTMTKGSKHKEPPVRHERPDSGDAFMPDPGEGPARVKDDLAEELAEEFLTSATSAEASLPDALDSELPEETGGPFVFSSAKQEFARGTDASNPRNAKKEAFPTPNAVPRTPKR
jgi:hypothetical protein